MRRFQQALIRLKWAGTCCADANESAARAVRFVAHCARFCVLQKCFHQAFENVLCRVVPDSGLRPITLRISADDVGQPECATGAPGIRERQ